MASSRGSVQCLPMASGSSQSLSLKFGLGLWSGCQGLAPRQSTLNKVSSFSRSLHLWNQRHYSCQSLAGPRRLHGNTRPSILKGRTSLMLPILQQRSRKNHSETSDEKSNHDETPSVVVTLFVVIFGSGCWVGSKIPTKDQERDTQS